MKLRLDKDQDPALTRVPMTSTGQGYRLGIELQQALLLEQRETNRLLRELLGKP